MTSPLDRYLRIDAGKALPRFLLARSIPVNFTANSSLEELWTTHDVALEELRSMLHEEVTIRPARRSLLHLKRYLARLMLRRCQLCHRQCGIDRTQGEKGYCEVGETRVASEFLHHGEEEPLVPSYTVFFAGCNFRCVYCQNYDISTCPDEGMAMTPAMMAKHIDAQWGNRERKGNRGVKNVNWVGGEPTPNLPFVLDSLALCSAPLPQIWNSNLYLSLPGMKLLDGTMDIYLTDLKYGNDACARRLSEVDDYLQVVRRNHMLAYHQGEMLVRHLVLPNHLLCCTYPTLEWLAKNTPQAAVNVMGQYRPMHRAHLHRDIDTGLSMSEYRDAMERALVLGLQLI